MIFSGDEALKSCKVLSGGEKSRLALAKMLLSPANFLIFDEPTNHLDMSSKAVLQQALQQYQGTCMIVSHDRSFLDPIVNKVLEIQPGTIRLLVGNVSYYLKKKEAELISSANEHTQESTKMELSGTNNLSKKEKKRQEAERRNALSKRLRPLKKKINQLEAAIEDAENSLSSIEATMAEVNFYQDPIQVKETRAYFLSFPSYLSH